MLTSSIQVVTTLTTLIMIRLFFSSNTIILIRTFHKPCITFCYGTYTVATRFIYIVIFYILLYYVPIRLGYKGAARDVASQ